MLVALAALTACYQPNPNPGTGNVTCGDVDGDCPQGYACGCDGTCYRAVSSPRVIAALEPPVATAVWERGGNPEPRSYATLVYDRDREVVVLFGGTGANRSFGDTWEWDGTRWRWRSNFGLAPRDSAAAAYDEARDVTVVFSGYDDPSGAALIGTWEWDGTGWTSRSVQEPPPRWAGGMVYSPLAAKSLLFGGGSASGAYADLWAWDGTSWAAQCVSAACAASAPVYRDYFGYTFDRARSCALVFGRRESVVTGGNDLWCWNGTQWSELCTDSTCMATRPTGRSGHAIAYDEARDRTVLFGGVRNALLFRLRDTYEWNGSAWIGACTTTDCMNASPSARDDHAMVYDAKRQRVLLFGGFPDPVGDLWQWDGTSWSILEAGGPTAQRDHAMTFDTARSRTVMFDVNARTWEWDGVRWTDVCKGTCASAVPDVRRSSAMAFDAQRGETILFGGTDATNAPLQTTWGWNGTAWAPRCTTTECLTTLPAARSHHAMAYDATRNVVVMFGGTTAGGASSETWTWNGTAWVDGCTGACLSSVPPARRDHAMVYDAKRGVVVLFGGADAAGVPLDDTWEWNGTAWTRQCMAAPCNLTSPAARAEHVLTYDARRGRTVLFAGEEGIGQRADTWEWDGTAWTPSPGEGPAAREAGAATYDSARGRIVLFGGEDDLGLLADTWELHQRGEACTTGDTCASGSCVDGVCCDDATCATCEACNAGDRAGTCVTITNMTDADTCSGDNTCSAAGSCGLATGQPCTVDDECASLRCGADPCNRVCL